MHEVTIYLADGCHLCESAQRVLAAVREEIPFQLVEVAIDGDPELERAYRERIPVVEVDSSITKIASAVPMTTACRSRACWLFIRS